MGRAVAWGLVVVVALALPAVAVAAFPGANPDESVRLNTPNDPGFDPCEPDNEGGAECSNVFDQETERFGFAPAGSQLSALYSTAPARQRAQNLAAGRNALAQVSGVSADRAWKRSLGRPDVQIAILDTGIRWSNRALRTKVALNAGELPAPQRAGGAACPADDCNGDGAFDVDDFAADPRVSRTSGIRDEPQADERLDASDLLAAFSDRTDADGNGFVDDIAGWDFFDDDNDPYDASSYSSASNHGTGRAEEAGAATNDGDGGTGVCPRCQVVPLRIWDTFVVDTNQFALAAMYAADNGIEVVEAAIGGLLNSRFVRETLRYAHGKGTFFAVVSSDLNTANHNFPTTYDEPLMVAGTVPDVQGLGSDAGEVGGFLGSLGIPTNAPIRTWFRNSGTTQYGGKAGIVMPAVTGSQATGQAAGAAGLIAAYGRERGLALTPGEIKQLLTMTAEDVLPENTDGTGTADPAHPGWDQHFGYGRPDLGLALERVAQGRIPPDALITAPEWFQPFEVGRSARTTIRARIVARAGAYTYRLEWAPGIEPRPDEFRPLATGGGSGPREVAHALDLGAVRAALDARPGGGATADPTAPGKGPGDRDPNEPAFTVRVRVTDAAGNVGEDRKLLFAYRDATLRPGWPKPLGGGGESSQRLWDVDGDGRLDVVLGDSNGRLQVLDHRGRPVRAFNRGRPVSTQPYPNVHKRAPGFRRVSPPREPLRTPAIGDVDGDRQADIVASAGERVYAWRMDGRALPGFPVRVNPALSLPQDRTRSNHVKRGFIASPTLGDLDGDARLDIVVPALDGHVYAWSGRGRALPGFPRRLKDTDTGAESINTAALGDLAGDRRPEIVVPTNELSDAPQRPDGAGLTDILRGGFTSLVGNAAGGSGRTYALDGRGRAVPGWPARPTGAVPDALPLVGPGVDHVLGDVDGDGRDEAVGALATGDVQARGAGGAVKVTYDPTPAGGEAVDRGRVLNLFENPVLANLDGRPGLEVIKGGVTLNQLLNIGIVPGQNLPYNHVVQAWNGRTGESLPAFPQAVEDFQLLSSPAVADVTSAPGQEVLAGTGLYHLRSFNAAGREAAGWPKFTGGWLFGVPAVGDADGDGRLDVTALTREGNVFLWRTDRPACPGNAEWWTSRHDERSTGAYATDSRPPSAPLDLRFRRTSNGGVRLAWYSPGDDWLCGAPTAYEVIGSKRPFSTPAGARVLTRNARRLPARRPPDLQRVRIDELRGARYLAVLYRDDAGNWGPMARVRIGR